MSPVNKTHLSSSFDFQVPMKRHLSSKFSQLCLNVCVCCLSSQCSLLQPLSCTIQKRDIFSKEKKGWQIAAVFCYVTTGNSSTAGGRLEEGEGASHRGETFCLIYLSWYLFIEPASIPFQKTSVFLCGAETISWLINENQLWAED